MGARVRALEQRRRGPLAGRRRRRVWQRSGGLVGADQALEANRRVVGGEALEREPVGEDGELGAVGAHVDVGLTEVGPESPFAGLRGTDNQVAFTTLRYRSNPLVIQGPGAGLGVTAAGILNDVLELAGG